MAFIVPLTDLAHADLPRAGGKGANLGELLRAGLPVPPGFCVLTAAYRAFVEANGLDEIVQREIGTADLARPETLELASAAIRAAFEAGRLPEGLDEEIYQAYAALSDSCGVGQGNLAVAVRSSATAEDLPDLSFAGQQDTFLNVIGRPALLAAVVRCWSSLWTGRAIGYRARNGILHKEVALAVVVQAMVASEAAGVLFTANPLTGRRDETVIDATLGLGEALVAGKVEPDQYAVRSGRIIAKRLGAKALSIRSQAGGGTQAISEAAADIQALPDAAILELDRLGRLASAHFGAPQDVEWAWSGGKLYLVQSRPVTSLFPLPSHRRGPDHLMVLMNFGAVQGIMDPITPLGREVFIGLAVSISRVFGARWTRETQTLVYEAAERLFLDLNGVLRHPFGRRAARIALPVVEPGSVEALQAYLDDPRLAVKESRWSLHTRLRLARLVVPNLLRVGANLLFPGLRRRRIDAKIEGFLRTIHAEKARMAVDPAGAVDFLEYVLTNMPQRMLLWLVFVVVSGQVAWQGLRRLVKDVPGGNELALEVTRGLPHNVTTEMDLALWEAARAIQQDEAARTFFEAHTPEELAALYQAGNLPPTGQVAVGKFLAKYGVRGLGEIDLGRKRWREDPAPVIRALASYLKIEDPEMAPEAVFGRGIEVSGRAAAELAARLRQQKGGWYKAIMVRFLVSRVRGLTGLRETPKFTIIRVLGEVREALLEAGAVWERHGVLEGEEDVFFLRIAELKELAKETREAITRPLPGQKKSREELYKWQNLVSERRAANAREQRRRPLPRMLFGDGTAIYEGVGGSPADGGKTLSGSPVSPGQAEGVVHVVLDPFGVQLAPGEILVCPGTDPAWTPLFLAAGGLVMETGGLMTHGGVVAREYGIPAVVGVGRATERLANGMRVRVDGTGGTVTILD